MGKLYDKTGREIVIGDVLKVFHFVGARRKRHFMYKQVLAEVELGNSSPSPYFRIGHLNMTDEHYHELLDGRVLDDYEIIQSCKSDHHDRPKHFPT